MSAQPTSAAEQFDANLLALVRAAQPIGAAEQFDADLLTLVQAARIVVSAMSTGTKFIPLADFQRVKDGLKTALEQFEPWLEERTGDPRTNGWVDDKGRP